jgi:hypothetical protein
VVPPSSFLHYEPFAIQHCLSNSLCPLTCRLPELSSFVDAVCDMCYVVVHNRSNHCKSGCIWFCLSWPVPHCNVVIVVIVVLQPAAWQLQGSTSAPARPPGVSAALAARPKQRRAALQRSQRRRRRGSSGAAQAAASCGTPATCTACRWGYGDPKPTCSDPSCKQNS